MKKFLIGLLLLVGAQSFSSVVAPGAKTGKGSSSPLTTKGDLYTFGTSDCRLPVGTNGFQLVADSGQTCGVKWLAPAAGTGNVTDINSDATASQTLTVGTSGTDFAIVDDAAGDHKFNLPNASASARGVVSTGTQTFGGAKTFDTKITVSTSSGPMFDGVDGGTAGTNADPFIRLSDNDSAMGEIGYRTSNSLAMSFWNIENGNLIFGANNSTVMSITPAGVVNLPGITASRVLTTDSSKNIAAASMTTTQLGDLLIDSVDAFIVAPADGTYVLMPKARFPGTVNSAYFDVTAGSCTAALKINGTNITSLSAVSVTTTEADTSATGANTFVAGDRITMVLSSCSSAANMELSLKYTR